MQEVQKVMLVAPPGKVFVDSDGRPSARKHCTPPIGIAYLASVLRQHEFDVRVIDMLAEGYQQEWWRRPYLLYGLPPEDLVARVQEFNPQVLGFSVLFSFLIPQVLEICEKLKAAIPGLNIVLGGHHPSAAPLHLLDQCPAIDAVIIGEAEVSFPFYLHALNGKNSLEEVPNLYFRKDNAVHDTTSRIKSRQTGHGWKYFTSRDASFPQKLDELPFPAWDLLPMHVYSQSQVRIGSPDTPRQTVAPMLTSRGCPNACYFCTSALTSGLRGYRRRSNESILKEAHWLVDNYSVEEIVFYDDNFYADRRHVKELLKLLAAEFKDTLFNAVGGVEIRFLDEEMIDLMAQAKFYRALLAIESGDQDLQTEKIDKKVQIDQIPRIAEYCRKKGIETRGMFMIGFPGETRAQIEKTLTLARELPLDDFIISIVTAIPGTPLYDECLDNDLFIQGYTLNDIRYSSSQIRLPDVSPQELEKLRHDTWVAAFSEKRKNAKSFVEERHFSVTDPAEYERMGFLSLGKTS